MPSMRDRAKPLALLISISTHNNATRNIDVKILNGMSRLSVLRSIVNGLMAAVTPRISRVLQILDPTALPREMSPCPLSADDIEISNSGAEVPIPTIVRPMTKSESLALLAIATYDSTR